MTAEHPAPACGYGHPIDRIADDPRWQKLCHRLGELYDELAPHDIPLNLALTVLSLDPSTRRIDGKTQTIIYVTGYDSDAEAYVVSSRVVQGQVGLQMILEATTIDATVLPRT